MQAGFYTLIAIGAFWLGACPFSFWIGRRFLHKDIRDYGDGNPGAANLYRAGGRASFAPALLLDIAKGIPFVLASHTLFELAPPAITTVAAAAVLGHAFSPFLRFRGGKAVAVSYGALMALPHHDLLIVTAFAMFFAFLFLDGHAWVVIFGPAAALVYMLVARQEPWEALFLAILLAVFALRNYNELSPFPRPQPKVIQWLHSKRREA